VAALSHDNKAGLDSVRLVDNLFRRVPHDSFSFEVDARLPGAFAERSETALIALASVFLPR
jgi:hypothetical protein